MDLHFKFFATYREAVGQKHLDRSYDGSTVSAREMIEDLETEFEELDGTVLENGEVKSQVSVLLNGRDIAHIDGLDTTLEDGDTVSIFPPVAGG